MKRVADSFDLSATDLVGFLNCRHLTALDRAVAEGALPKPKVWDPLLELLAERGAIHEQSYIDHLKAAGLDIVRIDGIEVTHSAVADTLAAMRRGVSVIVQGALAHDGWHGRADILRRVEAASGLGAWSYEPVDTKLARETKGGTVLQLCLYADLLTAMQRLAPEHMYVVAPWSEFQPQQYRFADFAAYFRKVKRALATTLRAGPAPTYPDPIPHCEICRWREICNKRRRDDDHLCLVAGISKVQIGELTAKGIATVEDLAQMALPVVWKPERGSPDSYIRVREQARIVVEARAAGVGKVELLAVEPGFGLTRLPESSDGDVFLDLEGDPFVGEHGLEYLFGYLFKDRQGALAYEADWALSRVDEKRAFETFVDFVMARWQEFPNLHVYHYAPYEPAALKRLMGRYATREEEIDRLLRAGVFVDLYQIVRHALRASVESYSIKRLEPFYGFTRAVPLSDANAALATFQAKIELGDEASITDGVKATIRGYNQDDCHSAAKLRDWLEQAREGLVSGGADVPRPKAGDAGTPTERVTEWLTRINALTARLTGGIPSDPAQRNGEQQAQWILANVLDWHRREEKAVWWEYFRLAAVSAEDLQEERAGLSGLSFVAAVGGTEKAPVHRYRFPPQETEIRGGEDLCCAGGAKLGKVEAISFADDTVDIKKRQDSADLHPQAAFAHTYVDTKVIAEALMRLGEYVAEHGIRGGGAYQAARDLLLREAPRTGGEPLRLAEETTVEAATRLCAHLKSGVLPVQGPPGAGKTYTGAQMICELVLRGKKVGITANSHKVIRNLIDATIKAADERGVTLQCCQKIEEAHDALHGLFFTKRNEDLFTALSSGTAAVGGGTAWLWSRPDAFETVDVLFVDEAAQMSLANVLAVSQAAKAVVLIGDPQQLDQPMQGSHPDGTDVSALDHILGGERTIPADKGLFLEETWRLHPDICSYISELFYDGKLRSKDGLGSQTVKGSKPIPAPGLYFLPVPHRGNQNCSPEEARAIGDLVRTILAGKPTWIDRERRENTVVLNDIVIITPYNAQVFEIQQCLPGARAGTVDKFQGQEAAIAIYSTASSSYADAPRGMEFLYSLNRLNVAVSRAKCASVLVSSPQIVEAECRTPRQVQLLNAFCRYLEMASPVAHAEGP